MKKIKDGWFSYDPEDGFEFHDTEAEAKKRAQYAFDAYREIADEGWAEEVEQVCWGKISRIIMETMRRPAEEGESFDEYVDYDFKDPRRVKKCATVPDES